MGSYDLAKKPDGKWQTKVGRDILFIERNLDFLKPGGRMAIVLPQGRFNNSSDKNIRDFIAERCRILADMDQIIVPVLNENFKKFITDIINYSKLLLAQADLTYQQAEDLLLSELGLKD
ncbi:hypothetical protein [Nostoc sp. NOS(2021)]|uniref:hypothetical protein n=1 Tax=Nostoc sp. NOS(2021) TaxID=2815407 RepID=UPI0025E34737|nr:hypothetical protein [Nostoc sp. NOS(2021)]